MMFAQAMLKFLIGYNLNYYLYQYNVLHPLHHNSNHRRPCGKLVSYLSCLTKESAGIILKYHINWFSTESKLASYFISSAVYPQHYVERL